MADHAHQLDNQTLQKALAPNLAHPEKRLRQCAARLATYLPDKAWNALWSQQLKGAPQARLTTIMALLWQTPQDAINVPAIESALSVLAQDKLADHRLQAIRLIMLGLGDYHLRNPSLEVYTAYEPALPLAGQETLAAKIRAAIRPLISSGENLLDFEACRLLAMLEDDNPELSRKVLSFITEKSSATTDFHFLTVLSRLKGPLPTNSVTNVAHAILSLDRKLGSQGKRGMQNWSARLAEVTQRLLQRHPKLADAMLEQPSLASPGHVAIAASLDAEHYLKAARLFLGAVQGTPNFPWSAALIDLLASLPAEESRPVLRRQWSNVVLRDEILLKLSENPMAIDRDRFIAGLASLQPNVFRASLAAF